MVFKIILKLSKLFILIFLLIFALFFAGQIIFEKVYKFPQRVDYGVTFAPTHAMYLGLDWKKIYLSILNDLKVKNLRIPSYWSELEKIEWKYNFSDTDFMISEAEKKGAKIVFVLGLRQPRWPECHIPDWARTLDLMERKQKTLDFIQKVVERYKDNDSIWAWQVENEPTLDSFGECDDADINFLKQEVNLVRDISHKEIIITDSGELGLWVIPMKLSDKLGISVYKKAYDPILGYKVYPVLPYLYNIKSYLIRNIFAPQNKKTIIAELQAEPWLKDGVLGKTAKEQSEAFSITEFKEFINFAKQTGFDEQYLWGVEWWYWMAEQGHPEYLEYAKMLW